MVIGVNTQVNSLELFLDLLKLFHVLVAVRKELAHHFLIGCVLPVVLDQSLEVLNLEDSAATFACLNVGIDFLLVIRVSGEQLLNGVGVCEGPFVHTKDFVRLFLGHEATFDS